MKKFLTLFSLLALTATSQAQFSYGSIPLSPTKKIKNFPRVPFDKVIVFDNRFDTTNFLVDRARLGNPEMDSFSMPASKEIQAYIEKKIAPMSKDVRLVYINLKQLRFGNLNNLSQKLFFTAEVYSPLNDKLIKIFSLKRWYSFRHSYAATVTHALDEFIKKCSLEYNLDTLNNKTYAIEDLNRNVRTEWASLPILSQDNYVNGIYKTWCDFRDDHISPCSAIHLWEAGDGTYRISFSPENSEDQYCEGPGENIWAASYDGELYIPVLGKYFVRLEKKDNTFYFYVPHSMPDMVGIIPEWNFVKIAAVADGTQFDLNGIGRGGRGGGKVGGHGGAHGGGHGGGQGQVDWKVLLIVVGVVVVIAATYAIVKAIEKNRQLKKDAETLVTDYPGDYFRNCFLDMGTGDIIYR